MALPEKTPAPIVKRNGLLLGASMLGTFAALRVHLVHLARCRPQRRGLQHPSPVHRPAAGRRGRHTNFHLAPAVLFAAFIVEPPRATPDRYLTTAGMLLLLLGTLCHLPGRGAENLPPA